MPRRSITLHFLRMHPWHNIPLTSSSPTPRNPPQLLSPSHALKHTLFHLSMVLTLIATLLLLLSLSPYSQALDAPYTDPKSKTCSAPLLRKEWYSLPIPIYPHQEILLITNTTGAPSMFPNRPRTSPQSAALPRSPRPSESFFRARSRALMTSRACTSFRWRTCT